MAKTKVTFGSSRISVKLVIVNWFVDIDDCEGVQCEHLGTCIDGINNYTCDCVPEWQGDMCQTGD